MTGLLIRLFIKPDGNAPEHAARAAYGKLSGWTGIVCNMLLCAAKFAAGFFAGSVSVMADAANNLSDASSSVISLLGFKLAEKSADEEHPYGHARYEYLSGLLVAVFIIVIGLELLRGSIEKIIEPSPVEFTAGFAAVLAVSVLVKLWMMFFNRKIGRLIGSHTLAATAADSRNDAIATLAVLAAAVVSHFTDIQLDGIMGVLVALFILYSGAGLVRDAMSPLLGKAPSPELVEKIRTKIMSYPGVLGTHDLMVHDYGPGRIFASAHVEMAAENDVLESHDIIDNMERDFLREERLNMLIHFDPVVTDNSALGGLRRELSEIVEGIDPRLSVHDLRIIPGSAHTKLIADCVVPPEFTMTEEQLKAEICRLVRQSHPDHLCVITIDRSYAPIPRTQDSGSE